jgi:hypothetical protein
MGNKIGGRRGDFGGGGGLWETLAWFMVVGYITNKQPPMCMAQGQDFNKDNLVKEIK